jgi:predicted N-acyltransferase
LPSSKEIVATIHQRTADIPAAVWNALVPSHNGTPDNPFLDHAFFLALEESGCATRRTGWQPQHILLADNDGNPLGLMPLFLKSHSMGEYVFDHAWADAYQRAGGAYYPKLQSSVPFTPATGPKLLAESPEVRRALLSTAETLAGRLGASSVHATFVPADEEVLAAEAGWLTRHDTQFHWHNQGYGSFEDFLDTMTSRHRKVTRRERRDALADGITIKWLSGADLTEAAWDAFFDFYEDTGGRKWGQPYLNRSFFSLLGEKLGDRVVLMLAYDGKTPIAGALNLRGADTLYGRNWWATRQVPFLHFELCYYQAIDYAIAHGLKTVEAGAQGEHKLARGYAPALTRSVHWIGHPGLRNAVAAYLDHERASVDHDQDVLGQFTPFKKEARD